MLFNSYVFVFLFLPPVLLAWWALRSFPTVRVVALTIASLVFYGFWDWRFTFLMLTTICVDYLAGGRIYSASGAPERRFWLAFSLTINLGMLFFFKYADMVLGTASGIAQLLGMPADIKPLGILLPIGISFYTFQSISYSIDIYRGQARPALSLLHFAAYVSMFPQLVAGPIVRYSEIDNQLRTLPRAPDPEIWQRGLVLFTIGLSKKLFIADLIGARIDPLLMDVGSLKLVGSWIVMFGYSLQIYFDFSGYSDMAVGLGSLLGFRFPQNFNSPYKAVNPSDFWRRWHITLSNWLRDNLYFPLGGGRGGSAKTLRNLVITMFLGGLWHGAQWTFVVWGLYHGVLLAGYRVLVSCGVSIARPWVSRLITFLLVVVGWVFFRATSFTMAKDILAAMAGLRGIENHLGALSLSLVLLVIGGLGISWFAPNSWEIRVIPSWRLAVVLGLALYLCVLRLGQESPFLYFQF